MFQVTEAMIDRGAMVLHTRLQAGKCLNDWDTLPRSVKRKWMAYAEEVLQAAAGCCT